MTVDKVTVRAFARMKGKNITMLTAYDYYTARFLDKAGVDSLLVGDSLNMVFYGEPTTLSADTDALEVDAMAGDLVEWMTALRLLNMGVGRMLGDTTERERRKTEIRAEINRIRQYLGWRVEF